ncbi:MAG TPA: polysaccharide biosynthesis protein [Gammaproteobacteria bacterium]|jgi:FlaA1/EpsC-like NDP-sugar epimerase|nr:polysaccharide biosynthesis protein [Gammaproteobacteria bacterium]
MNLKKTLLSTSRLNKKLLALTSDFLSMSFAILLALVISNVEIYSINLEEFLRLFWMPLLCVITFWYFGVYSSVVRYIDLSVIFILARAIFFAFALGLISKFLYIYLLSYFIPRSSDSLISFEGWLVGFITFSFLIITSRLTANFYLSDRLSEKRVVIYGAGDAGIQLASALRVSKEMQPIAFIDSDSSLHGTYLGGIKVLHPKKLERFALRGKVDEVLIAMPSASKLTLRSLLKEIENYSVKVRILPGLAELAEGKVLVSELKEVDISDLLGRKEAEANQDLINKNIAQKVVLITGAGGSIGSEISRQVARKASKVILLDTNEYALYSIKNEIENLLPETELHAVLGSVTNKKRITEICKAFAVDTVYHAAAYKHVPLVEENPFEAVFNNIIGTQACVQAAIDAEVETFVLISTDKAVRPTNIMGATKRFSEMILQSLAAKEDISKRTRITMVRFGNVLGSSGSAIPLFQQQISDGGPLTVTDPEVVRYFMTIPEAAELVIQAGAMGQGGDLFVLDMGEPVQILELAKRLISLSGKEVKNEENPEGDIEIIFTGLRPGEKLFEELLIGDDVRDTQHRQIFKANEEYISWKEVEEYLIEIKEASSSSDHIKLRNIFQQTVSGFKPEKDIVDVIYLEKNKTS